MAAPEGTYLSRLFRGRVLTAAIALLLTIQFSPASVAATTGEPVAVIVRTGEGFATIQEALDASLAGDVVTVVMKGGANPSAYTGGLTLAKNNVTLCATVALGTCAPVAAPGRWQLSAATWGTPPTPWQGEAIKAVSPASTSFFTATQQPGATPLRVRDIDELSFSFLLESGGCSTGLRFQLRLDTNGDGTNDATIFAYPKAPFSCPAGQWVVADVLANGTWGLGALGGPSSGATKAQADALAGNATVTTINLVYDNTPAGTSIAWFDNQRINNAVLREQVDTACPDANSPTCVTTSARDSTILDAAGANPSTVLITGSGVTVKGFTIRNSGATGEAHGVRFTGAGAQVLGNVIDGNGYSNLEQFGVVAAAPSGAAWLVANNTITDWGHTGIIVYGNAPGKIADNLINRNSDNALYLGGGATTVEVARNDLRQAVQANIRAGTTRPLVLRDNVFGIAERTMSFTTAVGPVDARYNHWGAYTRADIQASMHEDGPGHIGQAVDVSCYYRVSGAAVCPPAAAFSHAPSSPHINTAVAFTDATTAGANTISGRAWSFGDGATSTATNPTHSFARSGVFAVTLKVTDSEGFFTTATRNVSVGNTAPTLAAIAAQNGSEGAPLTFALSGNDADGDALTYAGLDLPAGATVHATTGVFRWTPTFAQSGSYALTFRVSDGDLNATQVASIVIANVDRAPTLDPIAARTVTELNALVVNVTASDADGDVVALSASGVPSWASFADLGDGAGRLTGTPPLGARGAYSVNVTATANGLSVSRTLNVTVLGAAALQLVAEPAPALHLTPGQTVTLQAVITNGGLATDTFALALSNSRGWNATGPASVTLAPGESRTIVATIKAPAISERTIVTWKATSVANPSVTRSVGWSLDVPLLLELQITNANLFEGATVVVTAKWLDGTAAVNQTVVVTQTPSMSPGHSSSLTGRTNADGRVQLLFADLGARVPGDHKVTAVLSAPMTATAQGSYSMGL